MFITEQYTRQKTENLYKKALFKTGTILVNHKEVKKAITYKEITLALGILVALLIAFTLWTRPDEEVSGSKDIRQISIPSVAKSLFQTTVRIFPSLDKQDLKGISKNSF